VRLFGVVAAVRVCGVYLGSAPVVTASTVPDLSAFKEKRNEKVWECDCGGQLFYLRAKPEGYLECKDCSRMLRNLVWGMRNEA